MRYNTDLESYGFKKVFQTMDKEEEKEISFQEYKNIVYDRWKGDRYYRDWRGLVKKIVSEDKTYNLKTVRVFRFEN